MFALAITAAVAVAVTLAVTATWQADAAPGDEDATYFPTAGCRLADTRGPDNIGPRSTPLGADEVYEIQIHGANGECTGPLAIPADATGISANVTAVNATTSSNIRLYPANLTDVPLLSNLNVTAGGPATPNKVDVQLSPDGKIKVYNFRGSVDIVIDIVGFYSPSSLTELAASAGIPGPQGPVGPAGPAGVIELSHGYGADTPSAESPANVERRVTENRVGAGVGLFTLYAHSTLTAPVSMAGQDYALSTLNYCISDLTLEGFVDDVSVYVSTTGPGTTLLVNDFNNRTSTGCYDVAVNDTVARKSVTVQFGVRGTIPNQAVSFVSLTGTWVPLN